MSLETGSPFMAVQPHSPEGFHPPFLGPPRDPAVAKRSSNSSHDIHIIVASNSVFDD